MKNNICLVDIKKILDGLNIQTTSERIRQLIMKFGSYSIKKKSDRRGTGRFIYTNEVTANKVIMYYTMKNDINKLI